MPSPFTHHPHLPILLWTLLLPPLTLWDTAYIALRPFSFPGGLYHAPFFEPMVQWASVDHLYGPQAWMEREGFMAAQGIVNVVEAGLCAAYVGVVWRGGGLRWEGGKSGRIWRRGVKGRMAAWAVVLGLLAGVVTGTKTFLYFSREILSGYKYTGHNEWHPLLTLWGFMNYLYFVASGYMIAVFAGEILEALSTSNGQQKME